MPHKHKSRRYEAAKAEAEAKQLRRERSRRQLDIPPSPKHTRATNPGARAVEDNEKDWAPLDGKVEEKLMAGMEISGNFKLEDIEDIGARLPIANFRPATDQVDTLDILVRATLGFLGALLAFVVANFVFYYA